MAIDRQHIRVLQQRVDEILHWRWDPIGIAGTPQCRDEYSSYAPAVTRLLAEGATASEIATHLTKVATCSMEVAAADAQAVAELLIEHRDWIKERFEDKN